MPTTQRVRKSERQQRADVVEICRRMYARGYIAGTDGNVSVRLGRDRVLATPAGSAKAYLQEADLVITDLDGRVLGGATGRPSSELLVHLAAYRERDDVNAVVHAHPPAAVAHSLAGVSLADTIVPETTLTLGAVATVPYDAPGTVDLAARVQEALRCYDVLVMARHGSVSLGGDLFQAYYRLESLEHTARTLILARSLGRVEPLPPAEVERLFDNAAASGIRWRFREDEACRAKGTCAARSGGGEDEEVKREVVRRVLARLGPR